MKSHACSWCVKNNLSWLPGRDPPALAHYPDYAWVCLRFWGLPVPAFSIGKSHTGCHFLYRAPFGNCLCSCGTRAKPLPGVSASGACACSSLCAASWHEGEILKFSRKTWNENLVLNLQELWKSFSPHNPLEVGLRLPHLLDSWLRFFQITNTWEAGGRFKGGGAGAQSRPT